MIFQQTMFDYQRVATKKDCLMEYMGLMASYNQELD